MVKNSIISETGPEQQMYFVHVVVHEYPPSCQIGAMQLLRPGGTYGGEWGFVPICFWQINNPITMRILNSKGSFKYYVIKEMGGWGQKMAIFDDLQYCKSSKRWVGLKKTKT